MRVLERKEVVSVAGGDGYISGGGYAGMSPPAPSNGGSGSYATNPSCPPGYLPGTTGSTTTNGTGWQVSFTMTGPIPSVNITASSPANSATTTSGCYAPVSQTGAPETNPYTGGPMVGDPNGPTP
jgi:hypothetical protein